MKCVTVRVVEVPTTPVITSIRMDKTTYKVGETGKAIVEFIGQGGATGVKKKLCLYANNRVVYSKYVYVEPSVKGRLVIPIKFEKSGNYKICAGWC